MTKSNYDFSGVWRSTYKFKSGLDGKTHETEHYVAMHRKGKHLIVESLPNVNSSYLWAKFTIDGPIATGIYHSENSPQSSKKGAIYYGAAQMLISEDGRLLRGKGVGFGKDLEIKTNSWELAHIGENLTDIKQKSED